MSVAEATRANLDQHTDRLAIPFVICVQPTEIVIAKRVSEGLKLGREHRKLQFQG